jgi:WD40 repeat protein/uncharacterized caspase-like protein
MVSMPEMLPRLLLTVIALLLFGCATVAQKPKLYTQTGHAGPIYCVVYSPDGRILASASEDRSVKLWDVATRREIRTLMGHSDRVESVAFSPDGKLVASSGDDGRVVVWEVVTGARVHLYAQSVPIPSIAFSPNGKYLAAWSSEIRIWDVNTWKDVQLIKGNSNLAGMIEIAKGQVQTRLAFSPDSTKLAAFNSLQLRMFEVPSGKRIKTFSQSSFNSMAFSPDGKIIAIGEMDFRPARPGEGVGGKQFVDFGVVVLWDAVRAKKIGTLLGHTEKVTAVTFSPDGRMLASASNDKTARLWDVDKRSEIKTLRGHEEWVNSVAFSPDGRTLASAGGSLTSTSAENKIKLWDVRKGQEIASFAERGGQAFGLAVSADGTKTNHFSTDSRQTSFDVWDLAKGQKVRSFKVPYWVFSVEFSPDGSALVAGVRDQTAIFFDVNTGQLLRAFKGHADTVFSATISPDGRKLATGSADFTIKIWNAETAEELNTLRGHSQSVKSVVFSPDGRLLASTALDKTVRLWDVDSGRQIKSMLNPETDLKVAGFPQRDTLLDKLITQQMFGGSVVAFSPDGRALAASVGGYINARFGNETKIVKLENQIRMYDVASGVELRRLEGHRESIQSLSFSSDGRSLVSASEDSTVRVWDLRTGHNVKTLLDNLDKDAYAAFVPGTNFVVGVSRALMNLWDANSGSVLATMTSVADTNDWLVVTPDGLFDGAPRAWRQLLWRFSDKTSDVLSVESYFGEFFYPNLLTDIYAGQRPRAQAQIEAKDRRQPTLKIALSEPNTYTTSSRTVILRIEATEAGPDATHSVGSGVRDVRLFRNGSLVKAWRGDKIPIGETRILIEATIPVVAGENLLTAYGFNRDNIKSEDATLTITGAESLQRKGTAYVLAVGVNTYANSHYNLKYAVADANAFGKEFRQQQLKLGLFSNVEVIPLLDKDATKANILLALKRLAGSENAPFPVGVPSGLQSLRSAQPEDAVVVYFAGHGIAREDTFFLVPHDLGYQGSRTQLNRTALDTILAHSISDRELERAFEQVDASQILFIIDACNSGQALEAEEKRRGPMNSKGLAQLAYEKGMFIMTAAQSYQAALETPKHGHGYLTYVLVEEGLKTPNADADLRDGQVMVREWLNYGTQRVPQLQAEDARLPKSASRPSTQAQTAQQKPPRTTRPRRGRQGTRGTEQRESEKARQLERDKVHVPAPVIPGEKFLQQPRVFYRREVEPTPLVVARPN